MNGIVDDIVNGGVLDSGRNDLNYGTFTYHLNDISKRTQFSWLLVSLYESNDVSSSYYN